MSWFITNFLAAFLLPPLCLLLAMGFAYRRNRRLLFAAFGLLWLGVTPYFAEGALHLLESHTSVLSPVPADAIVILGGGTYFRAPEYAGRDTISAQTLVRLRYGARLQRETGKPILVTGGKPLGNSTAEAAQMREVLEQDFQVPVSWTEEASANTFENAHNSFRILQGAGIHKIYLVTHAWHMPRAAEIFRRAGFTVIEAPTAFTTRYRVDLLAFMPNAEALRDFSYFVHELTGLLWYRIRLAII